VRDHEPTAGELVGQELQAAGHRPVAANSHHLPAEGVGHAGVDAVRDKHEVGLELPPDREDEAFERGQVARVARARRQGDVHRVALALPLADIGHEARVQGIPVVLVERNEEHRRVVVERGLGAVAVVDVPVDDHHALGLVDQAGVLRGDRHVVEDAESHPFVGDRVMSRRAHAGIGVIGAPFEDRVGRGEGAAGGEQGDLVAAARQVRALVRWVAIAEDGRDLDHPPQVVAGVEQQHVFVVGRAGGDIRKPLDEPRALRQLAHAAHLVAAVVVGYRYLVDRLPVRRRPEDVVGTRIVLCVGLVVDETRAHVRTPPSASLVTIPLRGRSFPGDASAATAVVRDH